MDEHIALWTPAHGSGFMLYPQAAILHLSMPLDRRDVSFILYIEFRSSQDTKCRAFGNEIGLRFHFQSIYRYLFSSKNK